jgi:hypothetical protein
MWWYDLEAPSWKYAYTGHSRISGSGLEQITGPVLTYPRVDRRDAVGESDLASCNRMRYTKKGEGLEATAL